MVLKSQIKFTGLWEKPASKKRPAQSTHNTFPNSLLQKGPSHYGMPTILGIADELISQMRAVLMVAPIHT